MITPARAILLEEFYWAIKALWRCQSRLGRAHLAKVKVSPEEKLKLNYAVAEAMKKVEQVMKELEREETGT